MRHHQKEIPRADWEKERRQAGGETGTTTSSSFLFFAPPSPRLGQHLQPFVGREGRKPQPQKARVDQLLC